MTTNCVVCGTTIPSEGAVYSNTWERARRRYPCCSEACTQAFDPDVHWLPAVEPSLAEEEEQRRLLAVARQRLTDGDKPSVIVRELLLAGVPVLALRKVVSLAHVGAVTSSRDAKQRSLIGVLGGLIGGSIRVSTNRDKRKPDALEDALGDLERWQEHWAAGREQPR